MIPARLFHALFALLLALALFGPILAQVQAQEEPEATPPIEVTVTPDDDVSGDLPPTEDTTIPDDPGTGSEPATEPVEEPAGVEDDQVAGSPPVEETPVDTIPAIDPPPADDRSDPTASAPEEANPTEEAVAEPEPVIEPVDDATAEAADVAAANSTVAVTIISWDEWGAPLLGASFALYAGGCPATGEPVAGPAEVLPPAADIVFEVPAGEYCLIETTVPASYWSFFPPSGSWFSTDWLQVVDIWHEPVGQGPYTVTMHAGFWSGGWAPLAGAEFAIYAGGCPAGGTPVAGPAFVDPISGTVQFQVETSGWYCLVETTVPEGYFSYDVMPGGREFQPLWEPDIWVFHYPVDLLPDLTIWKVDQDGAPMTGVGFTLYDETCNTVVRTEQFTDVDGLVTFLDLPPLGPGQTGATYCLVETTVPFGYAGSDPQLVTAVFGEGVYFEEVTVINTLLPTADLTIRKVDEGDYLLAGAGFTIYDESCSTIVRPEQMVGGWRSDIGEEGRTTFSALPVGNYCVVESTVPEGYDGAEPRVIALTAAGLAIDVVNVRQTGTVVIEKYVCEGDPADSRIEIVRGVDAAGETDCTPVSSGYTFIINPFGGEFPLAPLPPGIYPGILTTLSATGLHQITEVGTNLTAEFGLASDETVVVRVHNVVRSTGALLVEKYYCDPEVTGVEFTLYDPVEAGSDSPIKRPHGCEIGDASFLIYPFGDKHAVPIAFATHHGTALVEGLPVTTETTGKHLLVETDTGAAVAFTIAAGKVTPVRVVNLYTTPPPDDDAKDEVSKVVELPGTGSGDAASTARDLGGLLWLIGPVSLIFLTGLGSPRRALLARRHTRR